MMLARGRHILIGLIALSTVVAGVGYSAFSFRETAEDSTSADPSPDNIRENFIFGNDDDSNVLTTKYYTVNFYSQYLGYNKGNNSDPTWDGRDYYNFSGYSHYLGYFKDGDFDQNLIEKLGGEVTYEEEEGRNYANCITFHNVSSITQEMLQAIRCPVFTDDDLTGINGNQASNGLFDCKGWVLKFISWIMVSSTGAPNLYYGLENNGEDRYKIAGYYPTSGFTVPNFNLSLSHYDSFKTTNAEGETVINVFPLLSTGKNYYVTEYDQPGDSKDAIAMSFPNSDSVDYMATDFTYDPTMAIQTGTTIDAYRFPGLTVNDVNAFLGEEVYLKVDIDQEGSNWQGTYVPLAKNGAYTKFNNDNPDDTDFADKFLISNKDLGITEEGRYNLYLFCKTIYGDGSHDMEIMHNNPAPILNEIETNTLKNAINADDVEKINSRLQENKIHTYKSYDLGISYVYEINWTLNPFGDDTYVYNARDFYLVIEKTFDIKLVGSEAGTWDYGEAPLSPGFNQMVEESENGSLTILDEYEVRDVTMDASKTTTFEADGVGTLILPQTYFGVGIADDSSTFSLNTVDLFYGENPTISSESSPVGEVVDGVPNYTVPDVPQIETSSWGNEGETTIESYFSKTYVYTQGDNNQQILDIDEQWSLLSLGEWCERHPESTEVSFINTVGKSEYLAAAYNDPENADLKEKIDSLKIYRVPSTGEYNFYLKFDYSDPNGKVLMNLYFYRIHNIFVKILAGYSEDNDVQVPVNSMTGYVDTHADDTFYSSTSNYFLLDTLKLDDYFYDPVSSNTEPTAQTLGEIYLKMQGNVKSEGYCYVLCDTISGQYALPSSIKRGEFVIHKNHILEWKFIEKAKVGWNDSLNDVNSDAAALSGYSSNGGAA